MTKANALPHCAKHNVILVCPDTSPRNLDPSQTVGLDPKDWEVGYGAGFYLDAVNPAYSNHFKMYSYITSLVDLLVQDGYAIDTNKLVSYIYNVYRASRVILWVEWVH